MRRLPFFCSATIALAIGFMAPTLAPAGEYPSRPVRIVVPFPAGGPADIVGRAVGERLASQLKQPFIVENRPGAGGNIGTNIVAKSEPDGYTLLVVLGTTLTVNPSLYRSLPFDPEKELTPIAILTVSGNMLVVHPSLPIASAQEFVAYARKAAAEQGPLAYASGGIGTPGHLVMEYFRLKASFEALHVAYRGNAPMVVDLLSGQVKAAFVATAGMIAHVRDGKLKGLAVSAMTRSALAPQIPTMIEAGYPGFDVETYITMLAPARLPASIMELLRRETLEALSDPKLRQTLSAMDTQVAGIFGEKAIERMRTDRARWASVVQAAKMRID